MEKVMEKEKKNSKLKVGVNVAMVDQDQHVLDIFVTIRS